MKRIFYSAIIALALAVIPSCKPEEEEINLDITVDNICGHWVEHDVTINGHKYDSEGSSTYDLKADGKFHYANTEKEYDGTWELSGNTFRKTYTDGDATFHADYDIDKLTNLTLVLSQKGGASTTYKRK